MDRDQLQSLIGAGDLDGIRSAVASGEVVRVKNRLLTLEDYQAYDLAKSLGEYWDRIQHVKKIFLNSLYGATLNAGFRFHDWRIGQSVTLSGRIVTKHMGRKVNELIDGKYDFGKIFITADTDSAYVTIDQLVELAKSERPDADPVELAVQIADAIGEEVNASFPPKMTESFFVPEDRGAIIKAGREVVASRGLFKNAKKRYCLAVEDKEGFRKKDMKIMGMETQRSDTPKVIQKFLKRCLEMAVMEGRSYDEISGFVDGFRSEFRSMDPWRVGTPCRVSNLSVGSKKRQMFAEGKIENPRIHFSVTAADNTNHLIALHNETRLQRITDGDKIEVIGIRPMKLTVGGDGRSSGGLFDGSSSGYSIDVETVAVPVSADHFPDWFKQLPFDTKSAEEKLLDRKLDNIFGILGWKFERRDAGPDEVFG